MGHGIIRLFGGRVRIEDHIAWERDFPVTYLLVREDEEGGDEFWGRCAGVEGLFVDRAPLPRGVLTLRDCVPEGALEDALSRGGGATGSLGDLCVEVWDERQPVQWWHLEDTVVIAQRPSRTAPALVDVTVGAGVEETHEWSRTLPASPRFELFAGVAVLPAGRCLGVDGLFVSREAPPRTPLELVGCEAAEPLLAVLRRPREPERGLVQVWALDREGRVMYRHDVNPDDITEARPSVLGGTLIDITLADGGDDRPPTVARQIWETWYQGVPTTPNQWAPYTARGRAEWLELTATGMNGQGPDRTGGVHHLDGRFVTDVPGTHCALAEALVGPGGYFGRGWDAFKDCLGGGFGVATPFTLVWHDADIARGALAEVTPDGERLSYFEDVVRLMERYGVTVLLR